MKNIKLISVLLSVLMIFAMLFAACTEEGTDTTADPGTSASPNVTDAPAVTDETTEAPVGTDAPDVTTDPENTVVAEHVWSEWITVKAATCTENGTSERSCTNCSEKETNSIAATGHSFGDWATVKAASCTAEGSSERSCSCGEKETKSIPATGHSFGELNTVKITSCTEEGLAERVCSCGEKETVTIEKTAHRAGDWIVDKEATANAEGSKHQPCAVCGTVLKTEVIPVTPHVMGEWIVDKEATCTEDGSKHRVCTKCGDTESEPINKKGHKEVIDAAKDATCTDKGFTEGKHCSVCNAVTVAQKEVPAKGHTEVIDAAKDATCTEKGISEGKHCSVCNAVTVAQKEVPAKGHTEVIDAAKDATCTEKGISEGKHCSVCNAVITAQKEVPAKGHTESDWIIDKEATTSATGSKHTACTVCGVTIKTETIPVIDLAKIDYTVTVLDGNGNPIEGALVTFMSPMAPVGSVKTDANGKAVCKLKEGEYEADVEVSDAYYVNGYVKLTAQEPAAEVIAVGYITGLIKEYPDEKNGFYRVGLGSYRVYLEKDVNRYYLFAPGDGGYYNVSVDSKDVEIGYYGSSYFLLPSNIGTIDADGSMTLKVLHAEENNVLIIGLKSKSASVSECTLKIVKTSDIGITVPELPYDTYEADIPVSKTKTPEGDRVYVDIAVNLSTMSGMNEIKVVYNEADGYYHLHTKDGPVLYVTITQATNYQEALSGIASSTIVGKVFYDEQGNFIKKESYNEALAGKKNHTSPSGEVVKKGYAQVADTRYGVVPLDDDLIHILKNIGDGGWYEKGMPGQTDWIFGDAIVKPENCWLFAVCYFE